MRNFCIALLIGASSAWGNLADLKDFGQTFINDRLIGEGLIFEILMENLSAVKCIDRGKVYLKPERIVPSDEGLMLVTDDSSMILLPQIFSDKHGCFIQIITKTSLSSCVSCGFLFSTEGTHVCCPRCSSE